jgi:vacuolar-type H+-ATPase subunit H
MATSSKSQEEYIHSLRQIKETEEKAQEEIENSRKQVEQEIKKLQDDLEKAIELAKQDGEKMVEKSIEESRDKALGESDRIIQDATNKSNSISFEPNKQAIREIMDILFSEVR